LVGAPGIPYMKCIIGGYFYICFQIEADVLAVESFTGVRVIFYFQFDPILEYIIDGKKWLIFRLKLQKMKMLEKKREYAFRQAHALSLICNTVFDQILWRLSALVYNTNPCAGRSILPDWKCELRMRRITTTTTSSKRGKNNNILVLHFMQVFTVIYGIIPHYFCLTLLNG
jgi:hypothetical protein